MIFAESLISFESLVPLALFGTFAAIAWWGLDYMMAGKPRAMERLEDAGLFHRGAFRAGDVDTRQ